MRKLLILGLIFIGGSPLFAQLYDNVFTVAWNPEIPLTNKNFASGASTKGIQLTYQKFFADHFSAGLEAGSILFDNYIPRKTYDFPGGSLTTDFQNYARIITVDATGGYYFRTEGKLIPFASLGLGVGYTTYDQYFNAYSSSDSKTGFLARPAAGVLIRTRDYSKWGLRAGLHADYVSAKFADIDAENFFNVGFTLGLAFFED